MLHVRFNGQKGFSVYFSVWCTYHSTPLTGAHNRLQRQDTISGRLHDRYRLQGVSVNKKNKAANCFEVKICTLNVVVIKLLRHMIYR